MAIREMNPADASEVSRMVLAAFRESIAGELSEEGVHAFCELASPEAFSKRLTEDNLMFVFEAQGRILGMIELKQGRHLAMLFVSPACQKRGIGRKLVQVALAYSRVPSVTVSASLPSVPAYQKYGFRVVGPEEEEQGLRYIPMEIELHRDP